MLGGLGSEYSVRFKMCLQSNAQRQLCQRDAISPFSGGKTLRFIVERILPGFADTSNRIYRNEAVDWGCLFDGGLLSGGLLVMPIQIVERLMNQWRPK